MLCNATARARDSNEVWPGSPFENDPAVNFSLLHCQSPCNGSESEDRLLLQGYSGQCGEIGLGFLDALGGGLLEPRARLRRVWLAGGAFGEGAAADQPGLGLGGARRGRG